MTDRSTRFDPSRTAGARRSRRARRLHRAWAVVGAVLLALPLALVPVLPAAAADWGISKQEVSTGPYAPGDTVQWIVTVSCSDPNASPCTNAVLTDALPPGLELVSASVQSGPPDGQITADTGTNTVTYTNPSVPNGGQAQIAVTARIDPDLPFSQDGVPITNTATVTADNAAQQSASDSISPTVPLLLASETTKVIEPEGALAAPGTPATMTIGATNTSNDPVDEMVVQDPADPTAVPNPFTSLEYSGTGTVVMPPDATTVTQEYWDGTAWQPLDDTVDPTAVQGVRYTFSGDIQPGATASIPVQVQQSEAVADLADPTTVTNTASSYVVHGGDESTPTTAQDTYVITPPDTSVTASKSFDPATVSAGDPTTVSLGATSTGTPVTSMTITEPAPGTDSPFTGDDPLTFTGFGPTGDGTGVVWPTGATAVTVTFTCAEGPPVTLATSTPNTLPNPPDDCVVVGFAVVFTGDIVTGGQATVPFTADTDPDQTVDDVTHPNTVAADVPNADQATASADLVTLVDRLGTSTDKLISPSTIPAVPGQSVVVQLPSQLLPFGPDGSTTNADQVVIQDPTDPSAPGEFWSSFTASTVRTTDVPAGSTLTVNYWDGTQWVQAPGCGPYTGPTTVSCDLPDGAQGVQFVYDSTGDGFPPGTTFQPNFTADYTGPTDRDDPLENCGASSASSTAVAPTPPAQGCASVDPFPVDGSGGTDFIAKEFLGADPVSVLARSDDQVTAQITWSTNGFSGVDPMVISDIADPGTTAIAGSFYDAFDLVRIEPIGTSLDPLIGYDQVQGVELFIGDEWVPATGDPCPCDGSFPGYTLTPEERAAATSARLTYVESPSRSTTVDPTAPQPGDGVARSTQADGRHLQLTFQVRDERRSDGSPVLGSTQGTLYNTTDPGLVEDTARATATFEGQQYTDADDATVLIIDQPLNVGVTKDWDGGPISVPPPGTPAQFYPSTEVVITGTNESAAKVDQLRLVEPGIPGSGDVQTGAGTKPFDAFTLRSIDLTVPAGTQTTTVTLTDVGGGTTDYTQAQAEALGTGDLADVVGIVVTYDGLVLSQASGTLTLTLQLRALDRYTSAPVTVAGYSPVPDGAVATIADPGGTVDDERLAFDDATMTLQDAAIALDVGKTFTPGAVVEPGTGPVTMTLTGQPLGPSRTVEMVLTDDDPQFWNQYDVVGFDGATLTAPIEQVQVDAFTGGTFAAGPGGVVVTGGAWVTGEAAPTFALPDGVAPGDVQGLRFTFSRTDGSLWENPANPVQSVPISVERRTDLRTGGPVLTDLAANAPAPGESAPGVASNQVDGTVTGADLVVDPGTGEDVPVSGTADVTAQIVYQHATNGVEVVKDFDGVVTGGTEPPNGVFPMNIAVTNTGNRSIVDPVVTDTPMPTDAQGAQLRLADVEEPFTYSLTGADPDPADGDPLPTDPSDVTVTQSGDLDALEFTFPPGSALGVGQTYTVTVMVQFRIGLAPQTLVQNTAGVSGDRPWDECVSRLDPTTGACEADADVTPIPAGVLAQSKFVRATDDDALDVIVEPSYNGPPVECVPLPTGLYAYPCTPVIAPGHAQTWHLRIDNVGNLPMDKIVMYDRLPAVGDTGSSSSSSPRGSQWTPILTNDPPPALVNAPPGSTASSYYTTSDDYCMDDLTDPLAEPVCPTDDPATGWVLLEGTEDAALLATVRALKFVISFPEDDMFQPGEYIAIEGTTLTPAVPPEAGDRSIAWNSAAASGVVVSNGTSFNLLPTEGTKVGVATATGSLSVLKRVTGAGAVNAPATFDLFVQCTSAIGTPLETVLPPIPITVSAGTPLVVPNLPYGAECTLTEDGTNGQTALIVGTVTIGELPEVTSITAINRYDLASLEISKEVATDAVDQDGEPVPFGPFEATIECEFLGEPVYATGYGPDDPMVVTITDGETVELDGLPVGAVCTVSETGTGNASSVTVTVTQPDGGPVTTPGVAATLTLAPDTDAGSTNDVVLTNTYDVGAIDLTKVVDGEGATAYGAGPFTLAVRCTFDDDGSPVTRPRVVYDGTVALGGTDPLTAQVANLPVGAVCDVTEPDDGGATASVVTPRRVTVGTGDAVQVTATNTFDLGALTVDKVVDGDGADLYGLGPFEVTLGCTFEDAPIDIPGGAARELVPGTPVTYAGLPVGAMCTVTETATGGATTTTVATVEGDGTAVVGPDEPVEVTVTNTFDLGEIRVLKTLSGADAPAHGGDVFTVSLACTQDVDGTTVDVEIPGGPSRTLSQADDWVAVYEDLPQGADCVVTETDAGSADVVTVVVEGSTTFTDPGAGAPQSQQFRLPVGRRCLPVEVINTWTASTGAGGGVSRGVVTALPGALAPAELAVAAGCADRVDPGALPRTGIDVLPLGAAALLLLVTGGAMVGARGRRREA